MVRKELDWLSREESRGCRFESCFARTADSGNIAVRTIPLARGLQSDELGKIFLPEPLTIAPCEHRHGNSYIILNRSLEPHETASFGTPRVLFYHPTKCMGMAQKPW